LPSCEWACVLGVLVVSVPVPVLSVPVVSLPAVVFGACVGETVGSFMWWQPLYFEVHCGSCPEFSDQHALSRSSPEGLGAFLDQDQTFVSRGEAALSVPGRSLRPGSYEFRVTRGEPDLTCGHMSVAADDVFAENGR
jgi:hypothetical protein